ncbi:MAG: hypothetical protein JXQ73_09580 [Phycisphaerae bacterium]|nr:hypothetical protein [Phycisphaerae bacterium]
MADHHAQRGKWITAFLTDFMAIVAGAVTGVTIFYHLGAREWLFDLSNNSRYADFVEKMLLLGGVFASLRVARRLQGRM